LNNLLTLILVKGLTTEQIPVSRTGLYIYGERYTLIFKPKLEGRKRTLDYLFARSEEVNAKSLIFSI